MGAALLQGSEPPALNCWLALFGMSGLWSSNAMDPCFVTSFHSPQWKGNSGSEYDTSLIGEAQATKFVGMGKTHGHVISDGVVPLPHSVTFGGGLYTISDQVSAMRSPLTST